MKRFVMLCVFLASVVGRGGLSSGQAGAQFLTRSGCESRTGQAYLGSLSLNRYHPDSVSNSFGRYGSPYSADSIRNPFGRYGSPFSPSSATNAFATEAPRIYSRDGVYLGRLSANSYDPESVSNPYGRFGSPYSSLSINNRYGHFGSVYSPESAFNPYAARAPLLFGGRR